LDSNLLDTLIEVKGKGENPTGVGSRRQLIHLGHKKIGKLKHESRWLTLQHKGKDGQNSGFS
jgi:hypothetical protein